MTDSNLMDEVERMKDGIENLRAGLDRWMARAERAEAEVQRLRVDVAYAAAIVTGDARWDGAQELRAARAALARLNDRDGLESHLIVAGLAEDRRGHGHASAEEVANAVIAWIRGEIS